MITICYNTYPATVLPQQQRPNTGSATICDEPHRAAADYGTATGSLSQEIFDDFTTKVGITHLLSSSYVKFGVACRGTSSSHTKYGAACRGTFSFHTRYGAACRGTFFSHTMFGATCRGTSSSHTRVGAAFRDNFSSHTKDDAIEISNFMFNFLNCI
jgi:hypothetical protein